MQETISGQWIIGQGQLLRRFPDHLLVPCSHPVPSRRGVVILATAIFGLWGESPPNLTSWAVPSLRGSDTLLMGSASR